MFTIVVYLAVVELFQLLAQMLHHQPELLQLALLSCHDIADLVDGILLKGDASFQFFDGFFCCHGSCPVCVCQKA